MSRSISSLVVVLTAAAMAACASSPGRGNGEDEPGGHATVIDEQTLQQSGGNVLNILPSHVAGMRIKHTDNCPEILMRGTRSLMNSNDPVIYVDGTRSGNTCVLQTLVPSDIHRIEVYPMGVTQRPGYRNSPNGLILVFMKTSDRQ
ncbi:MAG: TonB-dependent receptor plug domain-containing protein [Longimicrobiales bacterium]